MRKTKSNIMAYSDGVWVADAIWGMNGLVFAILLLRLYTRIRYITKYGADDYLNIAAFVSWSKSLHLAGIPSRLMGTVTDAAVWEAKVVFFVANVMLQLAVDFGYGTGIEAELPAGRRAAMELFRTCGQMLASITTAIAKAAVGIFLLRLAIERWQRRLIWSTLIIFTLISLCKPTALSY